MSASKAARVGEEYVDIIASNPTVIQKLIVSQDLEVGKIRPSDPKNESNMKTLELVSTKSMQSSLRLPTERLSHNYVKTSRATTPK